jgi:hypothetical protein
MDAQVRVLARSSVSSCQVGTASGTEPEDGVLLVGF